MKTLEELNELLTDLPCPFAAEKTGMDFPTSASSGDPATNYETGVPPNYSPRTKKSSQMPLDDFNRLGNLATRELFFRRCGGIHTFDEAFSEENLGYAKGALLHYVNSDAKIFKPVESQESDNDLNFVANAAVIDAEVRKPSDSGFATPRVLWKSVGHVYGLAEGLAHFGVDFSRRQDIQSRTTIAEDSLVLIGSNAWERGVWDTPSGIIYAKLLAILVGAGNIDFEGYIKQSTCGSFNVEVSIGGITMKFPCKGLQGGAFGCDSVVKYMFPESGIDHRVYYKRFCGNASFPLAFFARKGTVISYKAYGNGNPIDAVAAIAYPLETSVALENEEGGAA